MNPLQQILAQLGLDEIRTDAKATAALARDLEYVRSRTYDVKYPNLRARDFIPLDSSVNPGAETFTYRQWSEVGMADIIHDYSADLPLVDSLVEEFPQKILSLGDAFQYSIQDLRASAMSGAMLDTRRATAARKGVERRIDDLAAFGNAKTRMRGFLNHPNVSIGTALTDGTSTRWVGGRTTPKAPDLIKKDMADSVTSIWVDSKQVHAPNTIILSTTEFGHIAQAQTGTENQSTILQTFLAENPWITGIDYWYKLDLADAAGTGPRMVTYERSEEVLTLVIPQEFEQFPPQAKSLAFVIPTHARFGGVSVQYPLGMRYTDGI